MISRGWRAASGRLPYTRNRSKPRPSTSGWVTFQPPSEGQYWSDGDSISHFGWHVGEVWEPTQWRVDVARTVAASTWRRRKQERPIAPTVFIRRDMTPTGGLLDVNAIELLGYLWDVGHDSDKATR